MIKYKPIDTIVNVNMCSFKKTYVFNVFVKYNNFSLLQKLVVAANHPNCGTVRTVSRVAVFAGRDKETQVWKSQKNKICMIQISGIENVILLNCMVLWLSKSPKSQSQDQKDLGWDNNHMQTHGAACKPMLYVTPCKLM